MSTNGIEIDVEKLRDWLQTKQDLVLIDCREPSEYETAKINGSTLIPMSQWMDRTPELEAFHGKTIVVHCHHGGRSMRITHWLRQNGFPEALNLAGGIDAWSERIDSEVPRY